jgi:glycosyltransferase involved in cell wall biosynthesis
MLEADSAPRIVVLIPCYNEEATVATVVRDVATQLPGVDVYVFDNNSTDRTAEQARLAGARVVREVRQGKGNVVNEMFRRIDADIYVLVDGDSTYDISAIERLIEPIRSREYDMVCGARLETYDDDSFRRLHVWGNNLVLRTINFMFRSSLKDILTGYRAFSRRFVKTFPALSRGFEVETELTLHALDKNLKVLELPFHYRARPTQSESKLNTFSDGFWVMLTIFKIFKHYKPLTFFGAASVLFFAAGLAAGFLPVKEFVETGLILRIPSIVLASALMILSALSLSIGLVLDTISHNHREVFQYHLSRASETARCDRCDRSPPG